MGGKNQLMKLANMMAREIVADQTKARICISFDAAIVAANKTFNMGPGRAAAFANNYNEALEFLATLFISDCDENNDKQIEYAKGKRDEIILKIVGKENFVPFDTMYGATYMDELRRIRAINDASRG